LGISNTGSIQISVALALHERLEFIVPEVSVNAGTSTKAQPEA
jgi:hypothetical protein